MREAIFADENTTCRLLQAWQAGGTPDDFHQLWKGIQSMVESTVRKTLRRLSRTLIVAKIDTAA